MSNDFWSRYLKIRSSIKVGKSVKNTYGGFMYRTLEQIFEALKLLEVEYNILFIPTEELLVHEDGTKTVKATVNVIDVISGEIKLSATSHAGLQTEEKTKLNASQQSGSASSYAIKYALSRLLGLDDSADPDSEEQPTRTNFKTPTPLPQKEVESNADLDTTKALFELKRKVIQAQTVEDVNELESELVKLGGDAATTRVIGVRAKQLGLVKKNGRWVKE